MDFLRRLPRVLLFLGRGAVTSVLGNLSLAVLSAALGLSLWLFVTDRENPREVLEFKSAVAVKFVNVPNDLAVANVSATTVRIHVEATKNELRNLRADDFQATVNLGGFERGDVSVAVDVEPPSGGVSVVDTSPAQISVTLDDLRTKEVPVEINFLGSPQQGYQAIESTGEASPARVTVSGAASLIETVEAAWADVYLTGRRIDLDRERAQLTPRDNRRRDVGLATVDPSAAAISVKVTQQEFTKTVVISPVISGAPPAGYNVLGVTVDPPLAEVTGPANAIASIDVIRGLSTTEIAIADSRTDVARTVQIVLPQGVRLQGTPTAKVTVTIRPARGEATFRIVPQVRNVGAGLAMTLAETLTITLAGDIPTLDALTPEAIVAIADAQGLGPGWYALPLQITPPAGTTVVRSDPQQIGVALTQRQ